MVVYIFKVLNKSLNLVI